MDRVGERGRTDMENGYEAELLTLISRSTDKEAAILIAGEVILSALTQLLSEPKSQLSDRPEAGETVE